MSTIAKSIGEILGETSLPGSMNTDVEPLRKSVNNMINVAVTVQIRSDAELKQASETLARIVTMKVRINEKKSSVMRPLNESLKAVRSLFAPMEQECDRAEKLIKEKILSWRDEVRRQAETERRRLQQRLDQGTIKPETANKKISVIVTEPIKTTKNEDGSQITVKKVKTVKITNPDLVPRKYLVPDMVLIRHDMLSLGLSIPGIEVIETETVAVKQE